MVGSYLWETFDTGVFPPSWTRTTNNSSLQWNVDDDRSVSTTYSLYGGNQATHTYNYGAGITAARPPTLDLRWAVHPVLRFDVFAGFAAGNPCPATNNDAFRVLVGESGSGTIPTVAYTRCVSTEGLFIAGETDLAAWVGKQVVVTFEFNVNGSANNGEGIYVDDVRLDEDGLENPGCCKSNEGCPDLDPCTADLCVGQSGGGVCLHPKLPVLAENFDDGVANGWNVAAGPNQVTWFVTDLASHSPKNSFQASNPAGAVTGTGTTTAYSPAFPVTLKGTGGLGIQYWRRTQTGLTAGDYLTVGWQYRTSPNGTWYSGGTFETITGNTPWTFKTNTINPTATVVDVRAVFTFGWSCSQGTCNRNAGVDDFWMGWNSCQFIIDPPGNG
ncbi:MAG: hypothetical protein FJ098_11600 [Deltaproteobacteria bacterium]|nr:hypothetical protein [Deltaproteobacteria bacterium]